MNMKIMSKVICVMLLAVMMISSMSPVVLAAAADAKGATGASGSKAATGIPQPSSIEADSSVSSDTIQDAGKKIVGILQTVGVVLSVVILTVIGIKYMMGSAEEKAEYKKTFMPYIIGAALIFAASVFAQVAYDFFNNI